MDRIRAGIIGASGYTGADLIRLLYRHHKIEIALLTGERQAGRTAQQVFPHLSDATLPSLIRLDEVEWSDAKLDVVFCALPHAQSQKVVKRLHSLANPPRVIDLSADFRLSDPDLYAQWYGQHQAPEIQPQAVYGLPELYGDAVARAKLVACPGCYPTAALLALVPPLQAGLIGADDIIIDAKSGVTGAGRGLKDNLLFAEVAEAMHPYGVGHHRHMPEIEQQLSLCADRAVTISFTPHLVPMNRGELETIYVRLAEGVGVDQVKARLTETYADQPFVTVFQDLTVPATRMVRSSNHCVINVFADRRPGSAIIVVAIDNLVKGSSGQAIQNLNIMMGWDQRLGLEQLPLFP